jgi:putative transcriptional regulator
VLPLKWKARLLAVAAIALSATLLYAALPTDPDISGPTTLAGQLLVAAPDLRDPPFGRAVILLARHTKEGALGVVINRPSGQRPLASLLTAHGLDARGIKESVRVFNGGPVSPEIGFVIHSAEYRAPDTLDIDGRVALTTLSGVLPDIGLGKGPRKSLVAFGYAGWAPSQLEDELKRGFWLTVPEDLGLVFDEDRTRLWSNALARHRTIQ